MILFQTVRYAEENTLFSCRDPEEGPDFFILMQLMYSKNFRFIDVLEHSSIIILHLKNGSSLRGPKFQNHFSSKLMLLSRK